MTHGRRQKLADVAVHDVAQAGDRVQGEHGVEAVAAGSLGRVHGGVGEEARARHHPRQPRPALPRLRRQLWNAAAVVTVTVWGWGRRRSWICVCRGDGRPGKGSSDDSARRRWLQDDGGEGDEQGDRQQRALVAWSHRDRSTTRVWRFCYREPVL